MKRNVLVGLDDQVSYTQPLLLHIIVLRLDCSMYGKLRHKESFFVTHHRYRDPFRQTYFSRHVDEFASYHTLFVLLVQNHCSPFLFKYIEPFVLSPPLPVLLMYIVGRLPGSGACPFEMFRAVLITQSK